jgi:hypothetical protein
MIMTTTIILIIGHDIIIVSKVVVTGLFSLFLLRKHFITEKNLKKKSGEANDEANFSFFILLHKRAKPAIPPYIHPSGPSLCPFLRSFMIAPRVEDSIKP